jgi:hypothetical protein
MATSAVKYIAALTCTILVISGCKYSVSHGGDQYNGSGKIVSQSRTAGVCEGVLVRSIASVHLTQADTQSIRVEADGNLINKVIVEKQNGVLVVGLPEGDYSDVTLRVYVSMKKISSLTIEGAGNIECTTPLNSPSLECTINGAGNMTLLGRGDDIECTLNGAGNFNAEHFIARNCKASLSGAGNCSVFASEKIDASVSGVGLITYYGKPRMVKTDVSGIGRIAEGD